MCVSVGVSSAVCPVLVKAQWTQAVLWVDDAVIVCNVHIPLIINHTVNTAVAQSLYFL
jgi:hypothetical protein